MSTATRPATPERPARPAYDVERIRRDFPILSRRVHGKPLVYLDNAATTHKPSAVSTSVKNFYEHSYANIHRGVHTLSVEASDAYEKARETARSFINAAESREIVFVRGTTEGINLVAQTYGRANVRSGDEVVISALEHHSNIVPWQILCEEKGAKLRVAPIDERGQVRLDELEKLLTGKTRIVAISHVSNALGTANPVGRIVAMAHARGIPVLVDGAQAAPRLPVDVRELDADFYTFSGHKMYAPTGVGILYAKAKLLEAMPPYQGGGDMISSVTFEKTTYNILPFKFEAGTPNIAGAIGLAAAMDYLTAIGMEAVEAHEDDLLDYATERLSGDSRPDDRRHGAEEGGGPLLHAGRESTLTTSAPFSTARGSPFAPATTARSRSWTSSGSPPRPAPPSASTTRAARWTRWRRGSRRSWRCSAHERAT